MSSDSPDPYVRALVEHAQDVLTVVGVDGRILYDSPSVARVLGYRQGELVGRNAFELVHPEDLPVAFDLLLETAAAPGTVASLLFRFRHRCGSWRFLESVGTAAAHPDGIHVVLTSRDVTERVHAAEAVRRGRAELEERVRGRTRELQETQIEMLERLSHVAEIRDDETGRHTRRVGDLAALLARELGLPDPEVETLRRAAPLHDIGKIGIPDAILRKRGSLTPEEVEVMRGHTLLGSRILAGGRTELIRTAEQVALSHHERWDGRGYPHGLQGTEIPLPARIVAVADVYDALTHDRPYRPALPPPQVALLVREGSGTHFDPQLVDAFCAALESPSFPLGSPPAVAAGNLQ